MDLGTGAQQAPRGGRSRARRLTLSTRRSRIAAGIFVLLMGGATAWYLQSMRTTTREAVAPTAPAFSIAILPFASPSVVEGDERIAKQLAQDLSEAFGKTYRYASVISPRLGASYADKAIDPRAVGRELKVCYVVEGALRRSGDRLVLTTTPIDAATAT